MKIIGLLIVIALPVLAATVIGLMRGTWMRNQPDDIEDFDLLKWRESNTGIHRWQDARDQDELNELCKEVASGRID